MGLHSRAILLPCVLFLPCVLSLPGVLFLPSRPGRHLRLSYNRCLETGARAPQSASEAPAPNPV